MHTSCQLGDRFVVVVAGVAGSGKTTLGRAVAQTLGAPVLDLDAVTNPLLDALPADAFGGHWLSSPHAAEIRNGRYAALRAVTADVLASAGRAVLVAPFTAELEGGEAWEQLRAVADDAGADLRVIHLTGDPALLAARRAVRAEARDAHRTDVASPPPKIAVIPVDVELSTAQQLQRVLAELGRRTAIDTASSLFSRRFDAVLFDLDGTLVDSTASVIRSWRRFAEHYGVSAEALHENHGQPARTLISNLLPPELHEEGLGRVTDLEVSDAAAGLAAVRGAQAFFGAVPVAQRAVVTSGSIPIATARLAAAGFDEPAVFVTADDVTRGKPDPEPFLTAAARLGVDPSRCLVVEDAPAGIAAARAAGCAVLAIGGTVEVSALEADLVVDGLDRVEIIASPDGLVLRAV